MLISCCINTYKRPILLRKLLLSLVKQKLDPDWVLEVIVVDNDELMQGKPIVLEFQEYDLLNIKYFVQPIKNISITRNEGVKMASGELILFVDDDGYATDTWIHEMIFCMRKYTADAVFGTVLPYYEDGVPNWIIKAGHFERLIQKTGEISIYTRTGNCLIKADLIKSVSGPFDPDFGLTGGEDSNLFHKLKSNKAKFIFCEEGVVYDLVPLERANLKWLIKRRFITGSTFTQIQISQSKFRRLKRIYFLVRSILGFFISGMMAIFNLSSEEKRIFWGLRIIDFSGHIAGIFSYNLEAYKIND